MTPQEMRSKIEAASPGADIPDDLNRMCQLYFALFPDEAPADYGSWFKMFVVEHDGTRSWFLPGTGWT